MLSNTSQGHIGDSFVETTAKSGGILSKSDLESYSVVKDQGHSMNLRGLDIHTCGFPTSGPVMLFMLNALDELDMYPSRSNSPDDLHKFIEVMKCMCHVTLMPLVNAAS